MLFIISPRERTPHSLYERILKLSSLKQKKRNFMTVLVPLSLQLNSLTSPQEWALSDNDCSVGGHLLFFLSSFKSPHTRRSYKNDIEDFFLFLEANSIIPRILKDISEEMILAWREKLKKQALASTSIRRKINALSSYFEFARRRHLIASNPVEFVIRPRISEKSQTNSLTVDEVKKILSYLKEQSFLYKDDKKKYAHFRLSFAVFSTLVSVGMRAQELCSLRIKDLMNHGTHHSLLLSVKGDEKHSPIIHPKTAEILKNYQDEFRKDALPEEFLFLHPLRKDKTKPISQKTIYNLLQEVCLECDIKKHISPHSCRATVATILHNQGVPLIDIQTLLNHKQVTTTSIYLKKADEKESAAALKINLLKR